MPGKAFYKEYAIIFCASGPSPLRQWGKFIQNGYVKRVTDEVLNNFALEICGPNISTVFVYVPSKRTNELGIELPILVMNVKNLMKYFSFCVTIVDDQQFRRRIRLSNFQGCVKTGTFEISTPLCLNTGWNQLKINLADLTKKAWNTTYLETAKLQINANCRIRSIFLCRSVLLPDDLPQKLRLVTKSIDHRSEKVKVTKVKKEIVCPPPSDAEEEEEEETELAHGVDSDLKKHKDLHETPETVELPKLNIKESSDEEEEDLHPHYHDEEISDLEDEEEEELKIDEEIIKNNI